MGYVYILVLFLSWVLIFDFVSARLELTTTEYLRDPETLESSNAVFKLGFFSPFNSTNRYLGIWYNKEDPHALEVVWVANRRRPINDSSAVLKISWDGNLQLFDGQNKSIWSSNVTAKNEVITPVAQLRDTGKLVLLSKSSGNILWQSVDHPTNLVLPLTEVSFDENTTTLPLLASWKSPSDPSNGRFTAGINHRSLSEIFIWDGEHPYWRSGPWDGHVFIGIQSMYYSARDAGFQLKDNNDRTFILSFSPWSRRLTEHYALADDGVMLLVDWVDDESLWGIFWKSLESECDIYGKCGVYGSCNSKNLRICTCLQGFEPTNSQEWSAGNWSSGCARRTPLQCGTIGGKEDGFFRLRNMKVPDNAEWVNSDDGEDCRRLCLQNCSCLAYAYQLSFGCMIWSENLIDIQDFSPVGVDLYIRLAHPELGDTLKSRVIIAVIVIVGSATLGIFLYYLWRRMNQNSGKTSKEAKWKYYLLSAGVSHVELNEFQDFSLFNFGDLVAATNNFSENTKLGRGGFGIVYKGTLKDGQEIAVKRLSTTSVQGVKEFINEVLVISKLQHRNLVRLLGCCIEGEEKLLIYEYMPNKSLDAFLFDLSNQEHLDWKKRFNVIKGIIRGLLYLHRDSRLRIIHRDLKASNVLLDGDFNPKISDFGMARIFGGNQDQGDTKRIVGTYGYMSPEYAMEGRFSEKSDVFSFGVMLLEIVSGRRNNSFKDEETLNLLGHAWKLWNENSILALIDTRISEFFFQEEILRCIRVGLLSVQELPEDRPSISMVLSMIESEVMDLPHPTQPGFAQRTASWKQPCFTQRAASWNKEQQNGHECYSVNGVSITSLGGR